MEEETQPETETRKLPRAFPATANYVGWKGDTIFSRVKVMRSQPDSQFYLLS